MTRIRLFGLLRLFLRHAPDKAQQRGTVSNRLLTNPNRAVSIISPSGTCEAARAIEGRRFLSTEAPALPLVNCRAHTCTCRYAHHEDRRVGPRRMSGRRITDQ